MIPSMAPAPTDVKKDINLFALYALKGALLFMLLSLFPVYHLTNRLTTALKDGLYTQDGSHPTLLGIALHGIVFFAISYGLMVMSKRHKLTIGTTISVLAALIVLAVVAQKYYFKESL